MLHIWSKDAYPTLTHTLGFNICISSFVSVSVSAQSSAWSALARRNAYPSPATISEANAFNKLSSWMPSFEIWPWTQISVLGRAKLYTVYIWYIILCMYRLVYRAVYLCWLFRTVCECVFSTIFWLSFICVLRCVTNVALGYVFFFCVVFVFSLSFPSVDHSRLPMLVGIQKLFRQVR